MYFDKSPDIDHRTIGGEAFIITAEDSKIHSLNAVGTWVFDRCDGKTSLAAIVDSVVEEFSVERETAANDVEKFIHSLETRGMIRRVVA
ncbi:MAG: PqqD family protein [Deltaproteobacteria bacterium]|nr:PqqD family protein [Deltaproteobacteria bacterium]